MLPERFESYEILRKTDGTLWELGRGAMGITYKAVDADLQVPVALKVINPNVLGNRDAAERFLREARSAAKLRHGNIASVFRLGRVGETHFYAMEFCEGQTVHQLVERRGPLELKLALEVTQQVTHALVMAQDHGVVHRDIKPSNLMVTGRVPDEFTVKVIDFGLAKHTAADSAAVDLTVASDRHGFVGTAHFASPEQLEDRPVDFRSDIYSLGVTLWFMLTGKPLFEGSLTRVVTQHLVQPPPLEKVAWLPPRVIALLESMLAKDPDQRPASMRALRDQLGLSIEESAVDITMAASAGIAPSPATRPPVSPSSSAAVKGTTPPSPTHPTVPPMPPPSSTPPAPKPSFELPPTIPPRPAVPPPPAEMPVRPKPSSSGPLILAIVGLVCLVLFALGAGYAFNRWGKNLFVKKPVATDVSDPSTPTDQPADPATPVPAASNAATVQREVRLAQDAAEQLSRMLVNADVNQQLIELKQASPNPDLEAIEGYRRSGEAIERNIIDAETAYLLAAKRLGQANPDLLREAFDQLEVEVSTAGLGWRTRLAQLLRKHVLNVRQGDTRVDGEFRSQLKALQKD